MMRCALIAFALFAVTGCEPTDPNQSAAGQPSTRQQPSNLTPGIHISGYANIGVVKEF